MFKRYEDFLKEARRYLYSYDVHTSFLFIQKDVLTILNKSDLVNGLDKVGASRLEELVKRINTISDKVVEYYLSGFSTICDRVYSQSNMLKNLKFAYKAHFSKYGAERLDEDDFTENLNTIKLNQIEALFTYLSTEYESRLYEAFDNGSLEGSGMSSFMSTVENELNQLSIETFESFISVVDSVMLYSSERNDKYVSAILNSNTYVIPFFAKKLNLKAPKGKAGIVKLAQLLVSKM